MLPLGTGILLCMAIGALGRGSRGKGGGGGSDGGLVGLALDAGASWLSEHNNEASTVESTAATTNATYVVYTPHSTAPYEPSTIPSVVSTALSASSPAVTTPTGGVDLTRLFGPGERPDIRHLEQVENGINDNNNKTLTSIATVLLALTKLQSEGLWIKSLFDLPGDKGSVNEGPDIVNITLYEFKGKIHNETQLGIKRSMRIDRGNLTRLTELGVESSQIKDAEPWWPWALIEGILEIESALSPQSKPLVNVPLTGESLYYWLRLLVVTANEDISIGEFSKENSNLQNAKLFARMRSADMSPFIFEREPDSWAVMMGGPHKNASGHDQYAWATPFPTTDNDHVKGFNSYADATGNLAIGKHLYVVTPRAFTGRPDNLRL